MIEHEIEECNSCAGEGMIYIPRSDRTCRCCHMEEKIKQCKQCHGKGFV